jgi:hypothetical protein
MNKTVLSLLAIAGTIACIVGSGCGKINDPYSEALRQEQAGNYPLALSQYVASLMGMTDARPIPSKAQGMASTPEIWVKELEAYVDWLSTPAGRPKRLPAVIDAIGRVGKHIDKQHSIIELPRKKTSPDDYAKGWNSIFYPEGKTPPPGQQPIIKKAMDTSISILTMVGNMSYQYEGKAVNCKTGKSLDFTVFNEGQFSLLTPPGNYYLIVTGKAKFQSGQVWVSPANVLAITVPDSASIITVRLATDVKRRT